MARHHRPIFLSKKIALIDAVEAFKVLTATRMRLTEMKLGFYWAQSTAMLALMTT